MTSSDFFLRFGLKCRSLQMCVGAPSLPLGACESRRLQKAPGGSRSFQMSPGASRWFVFLVPNRELVQIGSGSDFSTLKLSLSGKRSLGAFSVPKRGTGPNRVRSDFSTLKRSLSGRRNLGALFVPKMGTGPNRVRNRSLHLKTVTLW
jgi:hypothetical protein